MESIFKQLVVSSILVKGIGFGLILSVAVGPVFFALIKTSLQKGFKAGVFMAVGVAVSDITYIVLAFFGISQFFNNQAFKENMATVGGIIIIGFGLMTVLKRPRHSNLETIDPGRSVLLRQFIKGYMINIVNPSVLLFWVAVMSMASVDYSFDSHNILLFFMAIVATVFVLDLTKVYLANRLRSIITPNIMRGMFIIVGLALIGFGIKLMFSDLAHSLPQ